MNIDPKIRKKNIKMLFKQNMLVFDLISFYCTRYPKRLSYIKGSLLSLN